MPLTREAIEQVLRKYGVVPGLLTTKFEVGQVIDDLLALSPAPSRKELWKLLTAWFEWATYHRLVKQDVWMERFMAWARGELEQKSQKVWCKHLSWKEGFGWQPGWYQVAVEPVANVQPIGTWWEFCPICAAPRPQESP